MPARGGGGGDGGEQVMAALLLDPGYCELFTHCSHLILLLRLLHP